jgi:hypothetical protein
MSASFNRKLHALKNRLNVETTNLASLKEDIKPCEAEREQLIEKLRG